MSESIYIMPISQCCLVFSVALMVFKTVHSTFQVKLKLSSLIFLVTNFARQKWPTKNDPEIQKPSQ